MAQDTVERFLGRLLTDDNFRSLAARSLHRACMDSGMLLSPGELAIMRGLDIGSFKPLSESLDRGIKRFGGTER